MHFDVILTYCRTRKKTSALQNQQQSDKSTYFQYTEIAIGQVTPISETWINIFLQSNRRKHISLYWKFLHAGSELHTDDEENRELLQCIILATNV